MSDPIPGTGSQLGLHPQVNVAAGSTVRFQHVLQAGTPNLNVLSAGGQQFVITSQVSVSGLTQVIPTLTTSTQGLTQSGVARFVNLTSPQRVVSRGALQLASPVSDGRVSFVAISPGGAAGQIRAAAHPTLVTSLASPIRHVPRTTTQSAILFSPPQQPNHVTRKRTKLYENLDVNFVKDEKGSVKRQILDSKLVKFHQLRTKYAESAAELFFLQANGNIIDFHTWKSKRQNTQQFHHFLQLHRLDPEDEDEDLAVVLASADEADKPSATVAAAAPTAATQVNHHGHVSGRSQTSQHLGAMLLESTLNHSQTSAACVGSAVPLDLGQGPSTAAEVSSGTGSGAVRSSAVEKRNSIKQSAITKLMLNPMARQHTRQHSISAVYDNSIGSQEQIVEKAKQEAYVVQRVSELQREGLWSERRLPKVQEPPRNKAHWDYLLEEMVWLAADFAQERKWKKANAKKCAKMVQKYFQDKAVMLKKEEKLQEMKLRKTANFMAREVKNFWANVNKLVQYKQTTRLEEKRKKALDQHLSFIVDQTEKYSTWLAESMNKGQETSVSGQVSRVASPRQRTSNSDDDFEPNASSEDDEETIAKEEEHTDHANNSDEIERLKHDSEMPLEDLLKELPEEYWKDRDKTDPGGGEDADDFTVDSANETTDDEETLQEQEEAEVKEGEVDHKQEIAELEAEMDMDIEELRKRYSGAASPPLEDALDSDDEEEEVEEDEGSDEDSDLDTSSSVSEEEEEEDQVEADEEMDVGLRTLVEGEVTKSESEANHEKTNKEINDVAAIAQSLQPKGNTLQTTSVVTPIPFLLKHVLREYQHIGLDWLVTMFERKLNGILADEMGLGKTIQTIALLAHLACEKSNWGPHLIIVPTSVMLNWEMELKKWCPAFKILTYYGTQKERKHKRAGWTKPNAFHVCITSYKLVIQDHQSFRRKKWKYLILDEAQNIKNFKSQRWQLLLNFQTQRRLLLTGTPLQNNLMELWSLMHFLMPSVFQSHREFKEWFSNPVTGMIEGNSEYNESIIKRLHKVLRPFLLRRLKCEVEKQLPKKYEHVVMCRLSKRQRYLYDDFMSRAKTKETLATGNLLSVINVLMQLRKVCNHPNLFEVRPILSPFHMEGIVYWTASLIARALEFDLFKHVDLSFLNVLFVNLEKMTAYVSYRVRKLKSSRKLIEEIDSAPDHPPRCPASKIKICVRNADKRPPLASPTKQNVLSGLSPARVGTSPVIKALTIGGTAQAVALKIGGSRVQLVQHPGGIKAVSGKPVDGVQRLPVHLVQTSTGRHIFFPLPTQQAAQVSGNNSVIAANGQRLTLSKMAAVVATTSADNSKPRAAAAAAVCGSRNSVSEATMSRRNDRSKQHTSSNETVFYIPHLEEKLKTRRKSRLSLIADVNDYRCEAYPIYGEDLVCAVSGVSGVQQQVGNWLCCGATHCRNVRATSRSAYDCQTKYLRQVVPTPCDVMDQLRDVLSRFVYYVPSVAAPRIQLHVSHPSPTRLWRQQRHEAMLRSELSPRCDVLHPIASAMATQFPDPRLIQYDCGKLQVLDRLLRTLKLNHHKVLLFTQMTRMLDVLEAFLNYHGHIYLRLDGTTKVDQRQVLMERFNGDERIFCFILSTRSGGIGVNLTGADTVIFYDSDWNPTMDAQAQDRCHRIGQTRDVHIYRLVSEMTVEENILKKANQKRLLGDLAIEGGNFTTAYFKSSTIQDLFNVDVSETDASRRMADVLESDKERRQQEGVATESAAGPAEKAALGVLESALAAAEDESDVQAARTAKAEAAAELAEFDENIPLEEGADGAAGADAEVSKAEMEVNLLVEQLTPIERYAMRFVEENEAAWSAEQLAAAEAQIEHQKREWELGRLQALKAEEERRIQEEEPDEDLLTYSREDATNQVWVCRRTMEHMPMWCPPTPPQELGDVYIDQTMCFLYEPHAMLDTQLPPVYVKKELKRVRAAELSPALEGRRAIKMLRKEDSPASAPRSLFDHPTSAIQKMRREMKMQKLHGLVRPSMQMQGHRPQTVTKPSQDQENAPEWTIHEDWALLQSIEKLQELPLHLMVVNPGHTPNWDMVADMVNVVSRIYRSPSQCRNRYESIIVPREEGKLLQESKKQKKTKNMYKIPLSKSNRPLRTSQLYSEDNNAALTTVFHQRFDNMKTLSNKRKPTVKPLLVNPMMRNPKHAAVLAECGIAYDTPVNPIDIATRRAERLAKEKQKATSAQQVLTPEQLAQQQLIQQRQQLAAAAAAAAATKTAATSVASVTAGQPSTTVNVLPLGATVTVPTVTTAPASQNMLPINSVVASSSLVQTAAITTLSPGVRQTRPVTTIPVSIQEMVVAASQARTVTNTTAVVTMASLTPAQMQAARLASNNLVTATSLAGAVATVKGAAVPTVTVTQAKTLNQAQLQYYRQQAILRQQRLTKVIQGQQAALGQTSGVVGQQKVSAVATVSSVAAVQPVSPSQQKAQVASNLVKGRQEEMAALMKQQIQRQQKTAMTVTHQPALTAQILAQAGLSVQTATAGQPQVATLVKTSASGQSVTIPMAGIAIPQVKATINSQIKTPPGTTQQVRQLGLNYQQIMKPGRVQATKVTQIAKPGLQTQLIVQSQGGKALPALSMQHIQQVMKNVQPQHMTVSTGQTAMQQGSQVVLTKSPQLGAGTVQTRVIPVSGAQTTRQTIQVVPGTAAIRAMPNVTIDASGRSQVNVSSTLASALTAGSIKVAPSTTTSQQTFISQVAATLPAIVRQAGVNPVRIQTSSASGTPVMAVTVQQQPASVHTNMRGGTQPTQHDSTHNQS